MKITKKTQIPDYCEWFLSHVKRPAYSKEIMNYMLEHHHNGNRVSVRPETLSVRMKMNPGIFQRIDSGRKGLLWDLIE